MKLGRFELKIVGDGGFRLDGGAMFGVVPRVLWERVKPADERNRIAMATNCLVVRSTEGTVLIDTGLGDKHDERFRRLFGFESGAQRLPEALAEADLRPDQIDHVLLTHLHFDHCGWNTRQEGERLVPTFPRARYWIEEKELQHASEPNERDRASYDARNWEPLLEAGQVELFSDEAEPVPGVRAVRVPGHNEGMCIVLIDGGQEAKAAFLADLVPTAAHLPYPWIMSFDLFPVTTLENKKRWLPRLAAEDRICFFEHDPVTPAARLIEERPGRFAARPLGEG
jgi:glyoxylase-like metal-dependent hydrolase (beta-lactamase superfamily II)